jgi:hypothetical protein
VRTHAECRRNETTGKEERQMNSIRPEMLVLYEHGRKSAGQEAWAIALAGSFVKSKDASGRRGQ